MTHSSVREARPEKVLQKQGSKHQAKCDLLESLGIDLLETILIRAGKCTPLGISQSPDDVAVRSLRQEPEPPKCERPATTYTALSAGVPRTTKFAALERIMPVERDQKQQRELQPRPVPQHLWRNVYTSHDFHSVETIESLLARYGQTAHMSTHDHSYQFLINQTRTGSLSYKVINKVAVVSGDPMCSVPRYIDILDEFYHHCIAQHWQFMMTAASSAMADAAKSRSWTTVRFARERVLNTHANPVLVGTAGKRIRTQCKQLLNAGIQVGVYCPLYGRDTKLETQIVDIYDAWRAHRNTTRDCQAYVTVFDL